MMTALYWRIYKAGLRPVEVAHRLKVAPSTLSRIASGQLKPSKLLEKRIEEVIKRGKR